MRRLLRRPGEAAGRSRRSTQNTIRGSLSSRKQPDVLSATRRNLGYRRRSPLSTRDALSSLRLRRRDSDEVRVAGHVTRGTMTQSFRSRLNRNDIADFRYGGDKAAGSAHSRFCNYYATVPVNDRP